MYFARLVAMTSAAPSPAATGGWLALPLVPSSPRSCVPRLSSVGRSRARTCHWSIELARKSRPQHVRSPRLAGLLQQLSTLTRLDGLAECSVPSLDRPQLYCDDTPAALPFLHCTQQSMQRRHQMSVRFLPHDMSNACTLVNYADLATSPICNLR